MSDALVRARYEETPYRQSSFPRLHPARLGAIGHLLGMNCAPPDKCRLLELGMGEGQNLLPLAERFPESHFVGIDFSTPEVELAQRAQAATGLKNAELICGDFMDFEPEPQSFDYVVAHGIYSWVPGPVKDRLLALTQRALKPGGLAMVSYNVLPGWSPWLPLRQVLLREIADEVTPKARLVRAGTAVRVMQQCLEHMKGPDAEFLRHDLEKRLKKDQMGFYHDEIDAVNDPVTFLTFFEHAQRHGLKYFGDAYYGSDLLEVMPAAIRQTLSIIQPDRPKLQQYLDIMRMRSFRSSLLTHDATPVASGLQLERLPTLAIGSRFTIASQFLDLTPEVPVDFAGPNNFKRTFTQPLEKAFFGLLAREHPRRLLFSEAYERVVRDLEAAGLAAPTPEDQHRLQLLLLGFYFVEYIDFLLPGDGAWLRPCTEPKLSPLLRWQAQNNLALVNWWHEPIQYTQQDLTWLAEGKDEAPGADRAIIGEFRKNGVMW